ncbi:hypothetical protein BRADI_4g40222v3 [Brachypodium distachyon]|uniref:DUF4283 domain-containing protein n=1 Tax=Brachypodium distachyon TaxID=15368 RepID=A0A0Q3HU86_BRADI|nr:hypothetical protein BRADI_4g40222v3 [Brachypodium distachyon]
MDEGPWNFRDYGVVLAEYDGFSRTSEVNLNKLQMWIRIHKIPPMFRKEELIRVMGEVFARVRDVFDGKSDIILRVTYEKVPKFCEICGLLGYVLKECRGYTRSGRTEGRGAGREQAMPRKQENRKRSSGDASLESSPSKVNKPPGLLTYKPKGGESPAKKNLELSLATGENFDKQLMVVPPPPPKYVAPRDKKMPRRAVSTLRLKQSLAIRRPPLRRTARPNEYFSVELSGLGQGRDSS